MNTISHPAFSQLRAHPLLPLPVVKPNPRIATHRLSFGVQDRSLSLKALNQQIEATYQKEKRPVLLAQCLWPVQTLIGLASILFLPASVGRKLSWPNPKSDLAELKQDITARISFEATGDANHLNPYLPYRQSLAKQPNALKKYDDQVERLATQLTMMEAPMHQSDLSFALLKRLFKQKYPNEPDKLNLLTRYQSGVKAVLSAVNVLQFMLRSKKNAAKPLPTELQSILKSLTPEDISTKCKTLTKNSAHRYLLAASILEMFHNRPDLIRTYPVN